MDTLIAFLVGILIGAIFGIFIAGCVFSASDNNDEEQEKWIKEYNSRRHKNESN